MSSVGAMFYFFLYEKEKNKKKVYNRANTITISSIRKLYINEIQGIYAEKAAFFAFKKRVRHTHTAYEYYKF